MFMTLPQQPWHIVYNHDGSCALKDAVQGVLAIFSSYRVADYLVSGQPELLAEAVREHEDAVDGFETTINELEADKENLEVKVDGLESKVEELEEKIEELEEKLNNEPPTH